MNEKIKNEKINKMKDKNIVFKNKKVYFDFNVDKTMEVGIQLKGSEVKSLRDRKANINGSYCVFIGKDLYLKDADISIYENASYNNHQPKADRKLLLHKKELNKLKEQIAEKGKTIVPIKMYLNEKGLFKVEIAIAKGRRTVDKREYMKEKDTKRELREHKY